MGVVKFSGGVLKSVVDVKSWLGYNQLKLDSKNVIGTVKKGFSVTKPAFKETFEEAMTRLNITENDLPRLIKRYWAQIYIYILFALIPLLYMIYLFWNGHLFVGLIAFLIVLLFIIKACSVHFYVFQIKNRKLGCTLKEWLDGKIIKE